MADERTGSWEKKNGGLGDEVRRRWKSAAQVEEELAEEQQGLLGLGGQPVVQMMGERGERVGGEMKGVDWTGTEGQEGWEVELLGPESGSGGVGGQGELGEEECHRVTPHLLPLHLLQGAGSVHAHWHGHEHGHGHGHENESEQGQELQDQVWTLVGKPAHHS